jgi:hypothetical protein
MTTALPVITREGVMALTPRTNLFMLTILTA